MDGPFGQQSVLGWGIVGIIGDVHEADSFGRSHHVLRHKVFLTEDSLKPRSVIVLRSKIKEVSPQQVLGILQTDFHESFASSSEKVSQADKRFLQSCRKRSQWLMDTIKCLYRSRRNILICPATVILRFKDLVN